MGRLSEFEYSVVANRTADPVPTRHGVYHSYDEAKTHISRVTGQSPKAQLPNLKIIIQPRGTASKDLKKGRIKMAPGASLPRAKKGRKG